MSNLDSVTDLDKKTRAAQLREEIDAIALSYEAYERVPYHEAGHALMHVLKKIPFSTVSIEQRDSRSIEGVTPIFRTQHPLDVFSMDDQDPEDLKYQKQFKYAEHDLMAWVAGSIAEMIFAGKKITARTNLLKLMTKYGGEQDYWEAGRIAHITCPALTRGYDKWLFWLSYRVEAIFKQPLNWAMIEAIVANLKDQICLTSKQVISICNLVKRHHKKPPVGRKTSKSKGLKKNGGNISWSKKG